MNYTNREGGCTKVHPYKLTANYLDKLSSKQVFYSHNNSHAYFNHFKTLRIMRKIIGIMRAIAEFLSLVARWLTFRRPQTNNENHNDNTENLKNDKTDENNEND